MQLLPKAENGRFLAVLLALIVLALAYLGTVHWWFTERHLAMAEEMSDLRENYARFKAKADQKLFAGLLPGRGGGGCFGNGRAVTGIGPFEMRMLQNGGGGRHVQSPLGE